jgi:uncharacterized protein YkwD
MRSTLPARLVLVAVLACALAALSAGADGASAAGKPARTIADANQLEDLVLVELNAVRRAHGLAPLRRSSPLAAAADVHSRAMGVHGFFRHESRDGSTFWKRVKHFYGSGGYRSWSVGENLLWASRDLTATRAVKLWMSSPGHRKNILTARWREIGLSAVTVAGAPGVFGGRDVVIVTTDFGARS